MLTENLMVKIYSIWNMKRKDFSYDYIEESKNLTPKKECAMVKKRATWRKVIILLVVMSGSVSGGFLSTSDSNTPSVAKASSRVLGQEEKAKSLVSKPTLVKNVTAFKAENAPSSPADEAGGKNLTKPSSIQVQPQPKTKAAASKKSASPVPSKKKVVYLTFDDGPEAFSPRILALLQQYHFKATFFMLDGNMKKYSKAVKQMVKNGHSVGMHGVSHDKKKFYHSKETVLAEMNQAQKTLKSLTGVESSLIRTPYGSNPGMTVEYRKAVLEKGYEMWDWNIDSRDWAFRDKRFVDSIILQLEAQKRKREPVVILLHERKETLAQLPALFKYLKSNNYDCQPLNQSMHPVAFAPLKK